MNFRYADKDNKCFMIIWAFQSLQTGKSVRPYHSVCVINTNNIDKNTLNDLKIKLSKLFLTRAHSREHISILIPTCNDATETNGTLEVKFVAHLHLSFTSNTRCAEVSVQSATMCHANANLRGFKYTKLACTISENSFENPAFWNYLFALMSMSSSVSAHIFLGTMYCINPII